MTDELNVDELTAEQKAAIAQSLGYVPQDKVGAAIAAERAKAEAKAKAETEAALKAQYEADLKAKEQALLDAQKQSTSKDEREKAREAQIAKMEAELAKVQSEREAEKRQSKEQGALLQIRDAISGVFLDDSLMMTYIKANNLRYDENYDPYFVDKDGAAVDVGSLVESLKGTMPHQVKSQSVPGGGVRTPAPKAKSYSSKADLREALDNGDIERGEYMKQLATLKQSEVRASMQPVTA